MKIKRFKIFIRKSFGILKYCYIFTVRMRKGEAIG